MWHGIDPEGFHSGDYIDDPELGGWECDCEFRKHPSEKEKGEPVEASSQGRVSLEKKDPPEPPVNESSTSSSKEIDDVFALMESLAVGIQEGSSEPESEAASAGSSPSVEQPLPEPATPPAAEKEEPQQTPPQPAAPSARHRLRMLEEGF